MVHHVHSTAAHHYGSDIIPGIDAVLHEYIAGIRESPWRVFTFLERAGYRAVHRSGVKNAWRLLYLEASLHELGDFCLAHDIPDTVTRHYQQLISVLAVVHMYLWVCRDRLIFR